jgi:twitching motility protein PilU
MDREQAIKLVHYLLTQMRQREASDLLITAGFPPAFKVHGEVTAVTDKVLSSEDSAVIVRSLMNDRLVREFEATNECQFAIAPPGIGRFRCSAFIQQGAVACVLRSIESRIPTFEQLNLPVRLSDIVMAKRGLVLLVGATGSGKSNTLAAMVGHRNNKSHDHIITIEDPIEFVHVHRSSIVNQREIGLDTQSWDNALKATLRQAPDVILIGEIRTRETMEYAIRFAETGHLVLSTLHANNSNQALGRIIDFFPAEHRIQLLLELSLNLRAIISQRLVPKEDGTGRVPAVEIMTNSGLIADLISKGELAEIKAVMSRSGEMGMVTFDQALFDLFERGLIGYDDAIKNADSQNELRLKIKLDSKRAKRNLMDDEFVKGLKVERKDESGQMMRR